MTQLDSALTAPLTSSAPLGAWLFRNRSWLPVPLGVMLIGMTHRSSTATAGVITGLAVALVGESIRIWAVRHIGGISRTRTSRTGPLVTTGPYALVRNPLYVGNWLLWTSMVIMSGVDWMMPIIWMAFALIYGGVIAWEEELMLGRHPAAYAEYARMVPAWIPSPGLAPAPAEMARTFAWRTVLFSERGSFLAMTAMTALLIWRLTT